jgi:signal peptidase I
MGCREAATAEKSKNSAKAIPATPKSDRSNWKKGVPVVLVALGIFLGQAYVFQVFRVTSGSMAPTLVPEDFVLLSRLVYHLHPPRRGDLILFHYPQGGAHSFLKRIIGLPGETIEARNGEFWVNGSMLPWQEAHVEPTEELAALNLPPVHIPAGHLFVLGDNPSTSLDSRFWGTVDIHEVVGKALLICWSHGARWWDLRWHRIGRWLPSPGNTR